MGRKKQNKTCEFKGIVVTMTDGQENKSETSHATLTEKIKVLTDMGITFMFLAANQDAIAEAAKDINEETKLQMELDEEDAYQELLLKYKAENNLISDEEMQAMQAKKKKK